MPWIENISSTRGPALRLGQIVRHCHSSSKKARRFEEPETSEINAPSPAESRVSLVHKDPSCGNEMKLDEPNYSGCSNGDSMCPRCSSLGLEITLDQAMKDLRRPDSNLGQGRFLCCIGALPATSGSRACCLCRLFTMTRWMPSEAISDNEYSLVASSAMRTPYSKLLKEKEHGFDTLMLGVVPSIWSTLQQPLSLDQPDYTTSLYRYIHAMAPETIDPKHSVFVRRMSSSTVDYAVIVNWIDFCNEHHKRICGRMSSLTFPGLKVIDCIQRQVVSAPDHCKYLALSYVWGDRPLSSSSIGLEPGSPPLLIEDAISVTLRLKYRYLWVDRFCIDQEDENDKHHQIHNMHEIYAAAEITILASAADEPWTSGLPGVSSTNRVPQETARIGTYSLASFIPSRVSRNLVSRSKWASRAWTYQEAILSRRRLIFTQEQVLFECRLMDCQEALHVPLDDVHAKDGEHYKNNFRGSNLRLFPSNGLGNFSVDIVDRINEYTCRCLSYPTDAINGMLGIFEAFKRMRHPVHHIWGIPLLPKTCFKNSFHDGSDHLYGNSPNERLIYGLSWHSRYTQRPEQSTSRRIACFPSWSWAGWQLPAMADFGDHDRRFDLVGQPPSDIVIDLEMEDGTIQPWANMVDIHRFDEVLAKALPILHISAFVLKIKLMFEKHSRRFRASNPGFGLMRVFFDDSLAGWSKIEQQLRLTGEQLEGVILSRQKERTETSTSEATILIVRRVVEREDEIYERIGIIPNALTYNLELDQELVGKRRRIRLG